MAVAMYNPDIETALVEIPGLFATLGASSKPTLTQVTDFIRPTVTSKIDAKLAKDAGIDLSTFAVTAGSRAEFLLQRAEQLLLARAILRSTPHVPGRKSADQDELRADGWSCVQAVAGVAKQRGNDTAFGITAGAPGAVARGAPDSDRAATATQASSRTNIRARVNPLRGSYGDVS